MRVQLIDGDVVARRRLAKYLRSAGVKVQEAGSAVAALAQMWQSRPDVLVLDPAVPWSRALLARSRPDAGLASVPLLLVSAEPNLGRAVLDLRAWAGLAKPMDLDVLLAVLRRVAALGALRRAQVRPACRPPAVHRGVTQVAGAGRDCRPRDPLVRPGARRTAVFSRARASTRRAGCASPGR